MRLHGVFEPRGEILRRSLIAGRHDQPTREAFCHFIEFRLYVIVCRSVHGLWFALPRRIGNRNAPDKLVIFVALKDRAFTIAAFLCFLGSQHFCASFPCHRSTTGRHDPAPVAGYYRSKPVICRSMYRFTSAGRTRTILFILPIRTLGNSPLFTRRYAVARETRRIRATSTTRMRIENEDWVGREVRGSGTNMQ